MPLQMMGRKKKTQFYSRLQKILGAYPEKDVTVVMSDINGRFGGDNTGYQEIMSIHAL